jgi:hypothetical protein
VAAAKALAMTALDLVAQPGELKKAKEEFAKTEGMTGLAQRVCGWPRSPRAAFRIFLAWLR